MAAGMLVAAVVHGGVLRHVRGRAMERDRGEGEGRERVRESQGVRGDAGEIQGDGDAGRQGGGGRGACRRAASTRSAYWPGEEDDRKEEVGWAESARPPGKWASGKSLLPFFISFCFLFSAIGSI
jgi:hypothetical protein